MNQKKEGRRQQAYRENVRRMIEASKQYPKDVEDEKLRAWMHEQYRSWDHLEQWKKDILKEMGAGIQMTTRPAYQWVQKLDGYAAEMKEGRPSPDAVKWINNYIRKLKTGKPARQWKVEALAERGITKDTPPIKGAWLYDPKWYRTLQRYKQLYPEGRRPSKFDENGQNWIDWQNHQKLRARRGEFNETQIRLLKEVGIDANMRERTDAFRRNWLNKVEEYKRLYPDGKKPASGNPEEKNWYSWRARQILLAKRGVYSEKRIAMLVDAGIVNAQESVVQE